MGDPKFHYSAGGNHSRDDIAKWTFTNFEAGKPVQLFVNWVPGVDRASNAAYVVKGALPFGSGVDDSQSIEKTIVVDQRFTPGELEYNDLSWRSLGFFVPDETATEIVIELHTVAPDNDLPIVDADGLVVDGSAMLVDTWTTGSPPDGSFTELKQQEYSPYNNGTSNGSIFGLETKYGDRYEFDAHGLLIGYQDRNQNRIEYAYQDVDADGLADQLHTVTDQGGLTTTYAFNATGYTITDATGRVTTVTFDGNGIG